MIVFSFFWNATHSLRADTETVCIAVSVIGPDNGDPGAPDAGCGAAAPAESSSSSSFSSSISSAPGSASSSTDIAVPSDETSDGAAGGRFRHEPDRINRFIAAWGARHVVHEAPDTPPCAQKPYDDIPAHSWFYPAVHAFWNAGYLDRSCMFRPADTANRVEFAKILVAMSGGVIAPLPPYPSFVDVPEGEWYYPIAEEAARRGWMLGDGNCYGTRPCYDMPAKAVTRAEAAQMIVRFFHFERNGFAPNFSDAIPGSWYTRAVQIAGDHCILQGDDVSVLVRPDAFLNRAEMVSMLARAQLHLTYGVDCVRGDSSRISQHAPEERIASVSLKSAWNAIPSYIFSIFSLFESMRM